jgi:hypothetical protein
VESLSDDEGRAQTRCRYWPFTGGATDDHPQRKMVGTACHLWFLGSLPRPDRGAPQRDSLILGGPVDEEGTNEKVQPLRQKAAPAVLFPLSQVHVHGDHGGHDKAAQRGRGDHRDLVVTDGDRLSPHEGPEQQNSAKNKRSTPSRRTSHPRSAVAANDDDGGGTMQQARPPTRADSGETTGRQLQQFTFQQESERIRNSKPTIRGSVSWPFSIGRWTDPRKPQ